MTVRAEQPEQELHEERLARLIRLAARAFNRSLQLRLSAYNITFGQWIFLRIMWTEDGLSQRELAERSGLTEPTAHSALTKLEKLGLIERKNLPGNRRRQHAFLTNGGWALRDKLEPLAVDVNDTAIGGLSEAEEQTLRHALLTIIDNLNADEENAAQRGIKVPPTRAGMDV